MLPSLDRQFSARYCEHYDEPIEYVDSFNDPMPGIAVAAGTMDAPAGVPAVGITHEGQMLAIIGTSSCFMTRTNEKKNVSGISSIVKDGILPGKFGYEAGQNCVGDMFAWFVDNLVPEECLKKAADKNIHIQSYLAELAGELRTGVSGLIAMDWWSGNRSPLSDDNLSGMILGLMLQTKPEEIYRALVQEAAFGARLIVENYAENEVTTEEAFASGGSCIFETRKKFGICRCYNDA